MSSTIMLSVLFISQTVLFLLYNIWQTREWNKAARHLQRLMANLSHMSAMDIAVWALRLSQVDAINYVRTHVDPLARSILIAQEGANYDDWLRALYDQTGYRKK